MTHCIWRPSTYQDSKGGTIFQSMVICLTWSNKDWSRSLYHPGHSIIGYRPFGIYCGFGHRATRCYLNRWEMFDFPNSNTHIDLLNHSSVYTCKLVDFQVVVKSWFKLRVFQVVRHWPEISEIGLYIMRTWDIPVSALEKARASRLFNGLLPRWQWVEKKVDLDVTGRVQQRRDSMESKTNLLGISVADWWPHIC